MTDDEFLKGFETGQLAPAHFRHRDHVRLAWLYLARYGREAAAERVLAGIEAFARLAGAPSKFDAALTDAWVRAIEEARRTCPAGQTFDEFVAARPDLLDPDGVRASPGRLRPSSSH